MEEYDPAAHLPTCAAASHAAAMGFPPRRETWGGRLVCDSKDGRGVLLVEVHEVGDGSDPLGDSHSAERWDACCGYLDSHPDVEWIRLDVAVVSLVDDGPVVARARWGEGVPITA